MDWKRLGYAVLLVVAIVAIAATLGALVVLTRGMFLFAVAFIAVVWAAYDALGS